MKVEFKPATSWSGGSNVDGRASVQMHRDGMNYKVSATDRTLGARGGGVSTNGLAVTIEKSGAFVLDYDVATHSPTFTLHSGVKFAGKDVGVKYKHALKKNAASLENTFKVDDKHSGTVRWNLTNFDKPNYKNATLKWKYQHDDKWMAEPEYDFGSDAFRMALTHNMDKDNKLKAHFDASSFDGGLEWNQKQSDGNMKMNVKANMRGKSLMSSLVVTAEKSINFDV